MNPETALTYITLIGAVGTGLNLWISIRTSNAILKVKLWATDKFVSKEEITNHLSPIRESVQLIISQNRLQK